MLESEAVKQAILDAIPDLMFRLDRDGRFLDTRGDAAELMLPPRQIIGRHVSDVLPLRIARRVMTNLQESLATRRAVAFEYGLILEDRRRYFEARMVPAGEAEIFAIVRDITDAKHSERARKQAEHALQTQRALSVRSDRLRSLGEMAAGIAH